MNTSVSATTLLNRLMARTRLRHLQLLLQVADLGSVQQAATQLGMSQSAATKLIADVERVLEIPLFERHARGMRPTFLCRDLLPLLRNVMASLNSCAATAAAAGAGADGIVRVGAITAGVSGVINPALPALFVSRPQLRVELYEDAFPVIKSRYADGELDLLVARAPAQLPADSQFAPVLDDICIVVARPGHPLASKRNIHAEQLLDYPWATPPLDSQTYAIFTALFAATGRMPTNQPLSTRSQTAMVHYVAFSDALLIGPLSFLRNALDSGSVVRLDCTLHEPLPPLGLIYRTETRNRSVAELQAHLMGKTLKIVPDQDQG